MGHESIKPIKTKEKFFPRGRWEFIKQEAASGMWQLLLEPHSQRGFFQIKFLFKNDTGGVN